MEQLLTKNQLNELKIIKKLNFSFPNYTTIDSISKDLEVSKSSVIKLINSIETKNTNLSIIYKKRDGFRLQTSITSVYDQIRLLYFKNSILFNLCLDSFTRSYESPVCFSEKSYISIATFYNRVNELNNILIKHSLEFNSKTGEISGLSSNYRFFFYHFFWSCFKMQPCEIVNQFTLDNISLLNSVDFKVGISSLNPVQKRQFLFALIVNFNQIAKKKHVEKDFPDLSLPNSFFSYIKKIYSTKFYFINKQNLKKETSFFYTFLISFPNNNQFLKLYPSILNSYKTKNTQNYEYSKSLISHIEKNFPGIFSHNEEKINFLIYILSVNYSIINFNYQTNSIDTFNYMDTYEKYPEFFICFLETFLELEYPFKLSHLGKKLTLKKKYRFKSYLLFLSSIISKYNFKNKYNIQILTDSIIEKNLIKNDLLSKFDEKIIYVEKDSGLIEKVDLIITNLSIDVPVEEKIPIVTVNTPMDKNDIKSINNILL